MQTNSLDSIRWELMILSDNRPSSFSLIHADSIIPIFTSMEGAYQSTPLY